jgi:SAM-dependent methyltransferase
MTDVLPWTGERFVPQVAGDVAYEHLHRYALAAELAVGKAVLDIACGEGYGSNLLAKTARLVIGVDVDAAAVAHARAAYPADHLNFRVGRCDAIPLPSKSVDLVVSFETLEHHDLHLEMMAEVRRVLRSDGVLVISTPDKRVYSDLPRFANPYHVRELYRPEFEQLLRTFFVKVAVYGQRMCCGSVVAPLDAGDAADFGSFRGGRGGVRHDGGLAEAQYLIALATNAPELPPLPATVFESDDIPTDFHLREANLLRSVGRFSDAPLGLGDGVVPAVGPANLPAAPSRSDRDRAELLNHLIARIEAPLGEEAAARLAALREEVWYGRAVARIRAAVDAVLPVGATVAVVSRGDERLLGLVGRRAVHFPQADDGTFTGTHPDDDAAAVAALESARTRGVEFLVVPAYDLWLFDDYRGFARHVRGNYRPLAADDSCAIFDLRLGQAGASTDRPGDS